MAAVALNVGGFLTMHGSKHNLDSEFDGKPAYIDLLSDLVRSLAFCTSCKQFSCLTKTREKGVTVIKMGGNKCMYNHL